MRTFSDAVSELLCRLRDNAVSLLSQLFIAFQFEPVCHSPLVAAWTRATDSVYWVLAPTQRVSRVIFSGANLLPIATEVTASTGVVAASQFSKILRRGRPGAETSHQPQQVRQS